MSQADSCCFRRYPGVQWQHRKWLRCAKRQPNTNMLYSQANTPNHCLHMGNSWHLMWSPSLYTVSQSTPQPLWFCGRQHSGAHPLVTEGRLSAIDRRRGRRTGVWDTVYPLSAEESNWCKHAAADKIHQISDLSSSLKCKLLIKGNH